MAIGKNRSSTLLGPFFNSSWVTSGSYAFPTDW